jgi:AraC-like DNA-binding protein
MTNDFASAAMLRVLHAGMQKLGIKSPAQQWLQQATVPLDAKRQMVLQVIEQRGLSALVQLGQGVHELQNDSLIPLLIHPSEPIRMLNAWLRLERYLHSRHRLTQTIEQSNCVAHQHISIKTDAEPSSAEDLVVLGVLIGLLERTGCTQITAQLNNGLKVWPLSNAVSEQKAIQTAFATRQTQSWRLSWASISDNTSTLKQKPIKAQIEKFDSSSDLKSQLEHLTSQLQGQTLDLKEAAKQLGQSPRSLQRHLNQQGTRFVDVVATARSQRASKMLAGSAASMAEIGFSCGYTDQAHFCRDFKRRVGMSPLLYRESSRQ